MEQIYGKKSLLKQVKLICESGIINDLDMKAGGINPEKLFEKQWAFSSITNKVGLDIGPVLESFRQMGGDSVFAYPEFVSYQRFVLNITNPTPLGQDVNNLLEITPGSY